ncbi:hypothetical protein NOVO_05500 [Rickettsiales bacterium Ac37b]|nr:hypothetical protein NOVO_05500 [Rickettsiales bacterium Ac37b]
MEEINKEPNKFKKWEIVKVKKCPVNVLDGRLGFITNIRQFYWNGIWEYSILFDGFDAVQEKLEEDLESTGEFLSQEEIDERLRIISRKSKFDFNEIIEIMNHRKPQYIGKKGYIDGMSQNYNTGEWKYGISFLEPINDNYGISSLKEEDLVSTGEFIPKEKTDSGMSIKVTTQGEVTEINIKDPKTWEESIAAPDRAAGWKDDNTVEDE